MYNRVTPENKRRRRYARNIFRTAMRVLCLVFFFLTIGTVGGMELDRLGLFSGCALALASLGGMVVSAWLGGLFK